eukprot:SAG11_NODE_6036_length_1405_cov_1.493874_1_plen_233_part_00
MILDRARDVRHDLAAANGPQHLGAQRALAPQDRGFAARRAQFLVVGFGFRCFGSGFRFSLSVSVFGLSCGPARSCRGSRHGARPRSPACRSCLRGARGVRQRPGALARWLERRPALIGTERDEIKAERGERRRALAGGEVAVAGQRDVEPALVVACASDEPAALRGHAAVLEHSQRLVLWRWPNSWTTEQLRSEGALKKGTESQKSRDGSGSAGQRIRGGPAIAAKQARSPS